ncbi:hypothetical protein RUM44_010211 [Polyplax serrata]|uniref:Uncharacterized protein n=1 Tax=Polyplax serrata TaxID=468196 RepID=A0ABR1AUX2_POLSC
MSHEQTPPPPYTQKDEKGKGNGGDSGDVKDRSLDRKDVYQVERMESVSCRRACVKWKINSRGMKISLVERDRWSSSGRFRRSCGHVWLVRLLSTSGKSEEVGGGVAFSK